MKTNEKQKENLYSLNCERCGKVFCSAEAFPEPHCCKACGGIHEVDPFEMRNPGGVPVNMAVMQPTVTNKSEPVDLNYLYLVLSKRAKPGFDFPGITKLTQKVSKLGDAFMMDQTPGSGFFAKAEVDLIIVDILEQVLTMFIQRDISMDTAFKHITFPKGIITTVGEMDPETKRKIIQALNEPGILYIDTKDAKSVTCVAAEYPLRPEECDPVENVIDGEDNRICLHSGVLNYKSCAEYNTEFCKKECEHGRKEEEV